jgi:hypothetical protein
MIAPFGVPDVNLVAGRTPRHGGGERIAETGAKIVRAVAKPGKTRIGTVQKARLSFVEILHSSAGLQSHWLEHTMATL